MKPRLLVLSCTSVVLFVFTALIPARSDIRSCTCGVPVLEREPCHSVCLYKTLEQRPRLLLLLSILDLYSSIDPHAACWYGLGGTF